MIWCNLLRRSIISLLIINYFNSLVNAENLSIWLLKPSSRNNERNSATKRLPESMCPTPQNPSNQMTNIEPGTFTKVQWHNPNQIKAIASKIEILTAESTNGILTKLNSENNSDSDPQSGTTTKVVEIPKNLRCKSCVLRLTLDLDSQTQIVSCADVQILPADEAERLKNDSLLIQKPDHMETKECESNDECGLGECHNGRCYCSIGYYGTNCLTESKAHLTNLNSDFKFNTFTFPTQHTQLLWRLDTPNNAIEYALRFKIAEDKNLSTPLEIGNSENFRWIALGFRSMENTQGKCQELASKWKTKNSETNFSTNSSTFRVEGTLLKSEKRIENSIDFNKPEEEKPKNILNIRKIGNASKNTSDECGLNEVFSTCPEFNRQCEPSCDWTSFPESIPVCPRACGAPRCVCEEGFVRLGNDKNECKPFNFCQAAEVVKEECPQNQTWAKCGVACEPSCENMYNVEPCKANCQDPACTCADNFVRYNDQCIYWGNCPNLEERFLFSTGSGFPPTSSNNSTTINNNSTTFVQDFTTPQTKFLEKTESSTSSIMNSTSILSCPTNETLNECGKVCEADCFSVFVREECTTCGTPSCACIQGYARNNGQCVYWGDCPVDGSNLQTASTKQTSKNKPEIEENALESDNQIDSNCFGEWSYPKGCRNTNNSSQINCDYQLTWKYDAEMDIMEFELEATLPKNWWTGVGFSSTGQMLDVDMIVVRSRNDGNLSLLDMHVQEYDKLIEDVKNDIIFEKNFGTHLNGILKAKFARKRNTGDEIGDFKFSDDKCPKFMFPVSGGPLTDNGGIGNPIAEPYVSDKEICIKECDVVEKTTATTNQENLFSCQTEYRFPEGCENQECSYIAKWQYNPEIKDVHFEISSKGIGRWTGIGFSHDSGMINSDIYSGWVYDSKAYITDRFAFGRQLPAMDPADRQDIYNISGKVNDEIQTIAFNRKIISQDNVTDYPLNKCYYFLYPIGGGRVLAHQSSDFKNPKTSIGYHDQNKPESSPIKICICDKLGVPIEKSSDYKEKTTNKTPIRRHKRQQNPFENVVPGDLSEILPKNTEDPFACSDVTIIEMLREQKFRIIDEFAFSKEILRPDSVFGGENSFNDISVENNKQTITVFVRRPLNNMDLADFSFDKKFIATVYLAQGRGPLNLTNAEDLEFTKISFIGEPEFSTINPTTISNQANKDEENNSITFEINQNLNRTIHATSSESSIPSEISSESSIPFEISSMLPEEIEETTLLIEEIKANPCEGNFEYPEQCNGKNCQYKVNWKVQNDMINFVLKAKIAIEHWTGIGFSADGAMRNSDVIIVSYLKDNTISVIDQFSPGYGRPRIDKMQDIFNVETALIDGQLIANFSRSLNTGDSEDDLDLSICQHFIFLHSGGQLEDGNSEIRKHIETPISSDSKICLNQCQSTTLISKEETTKFIKETETTQTLSETTTTIESAQTQTKPILTTTKPLTKKTQKETDILLSESKFFKIPEIRPIHYHLFDVVLRIINEKWSSDLDDPISIEFHKLSARIKAALIPLISEKWTTFKDIRVSKFAEGSVLSLLQFEFEGVNSPTEEQLKEYLRQMAMEAKFSKLSLDESAIKVQENRQVEYEDKWGPLKNVRNWALIGLALLFLTSIVILLFFCSFRSRTQTYPKQMSFAPPHQSYQYATYPEMGQENYEAKPFGSSSSKSASKKAKNKGKSGSDNTALCNSSSNESNGSKSAKESGGKSAETPKGIGETTYQEWFSKVASKETPTHFQESIPNYPTPTYGQTPPVRRLVANNGAQASPQSQHPQSYVTYPNEPANYYTLNGEHRIPPPSYYRHY